MLIQYKTTANFVVSYDSSFTGGGQPDGPALAQVVIDYCEYDLVRLSMLFGNILPPAASLPIQINLVPGNGGANNNLVNVINCNCSVNTYKPGLPALALAELAEIFMNLQAKGWIANWSNGEALSRVSAQILYPNLAWLWCVGNAWLNGDASSPNPARSDWVDNVWHSDQDDVSYGCGTLFLNYLAYQLNLRWPDIIGAGAPTTQTLAETATSLGVSKAWQNFSNLISTYLPPGTSLPAQPIGLGQPPEPTDAPYPLGPLPAQVPVLYARHNLADDGTSHTGSLSDSPDIIVKNQPVANPQAAFSTPASISSDTESDPNVLNGKDNYVYVRVWNRGADATNVFATVYWSPPATLVTPNLWSLIGSAYYPDVPPGSVVQVSNPAILWPADQIPNPGHYCFVATVGNADEPAPDPGSFASWSDYVSYIANNNNITWRNFNVATSIHPVRRPRGEFVELPFLISGAWDRPGVFEWEIISKLPEGSRLALEVAERFGRRLQPNTRLETFGDPAADPKNPRRVRIPITANKTHALGRIELPAAAAMPSHLLVNIPATLHHGPGDIAIRQLFEGIEVGRITWRLLPAKE